MKRFLFVTAMLGILIVPACSVAERQGLVNSAGAYVQAPQHPDGSIEKDSSGNPIFDGLPDYDPKEVAIAAATEAASKAGDPIGLLVWAVAGGAAITIGWLKRRQVAGGAISLTKMIGRTIVGAPKDDTKSEDQ